MNWDWIAGFMEGEGHIYWQWGKKGTKQGTHGSIIIGQKCKDPLVAIREFLLKDGYENPILYLRPASQKAKISGEIWILALNRRNDVIRFLEGVYDGLFQKREKAKFVMDTLRQLNRERREILEKAKMLRGSGKTWREISRLTGVGRTALMNYFKAEGIDMRYGQRDLSISWRQDRVNCGLCEACGDPRGNDGTKRRCRKCADRFNEYSRNRRKRILDAGLCRNCRKPRGKNGTKTLCRSCADRQNTQSWIRESLSSSH